MSRFLEIQEIKRRPDRKSGFLFLILLFLSSNIYSTIFLSEKFSELLFAPSFICDESEVFSNQKFLFETGGDYFNIVRMSVKDNTKEVKNMDIFKTSLFSRIGVVKEPFGLSLCYRYKKNGLSFYNEEYEGGLRNENYLNKILLNFWLAGENVEFQISGGMSGKNQFPEKYREDTFEYSQPLTSSLQSNQIIYGAILKIKKGSFKGEFKIAGEPLIAEIAQLGNVNSEEMKQFPFYLYRNSASFLFRYKSKEISITKSGVINKYSTDSLTAKDNVLPFYNDILSYTTNLDFKIRSAEAFFAYSILGLSSYGVSEYYTYFKIPDGTINRFKYSLGYNFKKVIKVSLIGENIIGDIPKIDIDFSPFSVWSIFYPKAYRFEDSHMKMSDFGGSINLNKKWKKINSTSIHLKGSYTQLDVSSRRSEKKIYVLIPVYVNETDLDIISLSGFTGYLSLSHNITLKKSRINLILSQWLPLWSEKNDTQSKSSNSSFKKSIIGGTNIALDYTFSF